MTATKIRVTEVTEGMTVKGNIASGTYVVAEIRTASTQGMRNGVSSEYTLVDAQGVEFFIGRVNSKVTLV